MVIARYGVVQYTSQEDSETAKTVFVVQNIFVHDKLITRVDTDGKKLIALTFDDGPDPRYTPDILDILKEYEIKATFFVVGESVLRYPDIVRRALWEGHEIENHTFTHPDLTRDNLVTIDEEMLKCEWAIEEVVGQRPQYFRPPRKLYNRQVLDAAQLNGYQIALWTIGLENRRAKTPAEAAWRVIRHARPGMIILAHDGRLDRSQTVKALPLLIQDLKDRGYQFVTLGELTQSPSGPVNLNFDISYYW